MSDAVYGHLLLECEEAYGPSFWADFFAETRNESARLCETVTQGDVIYGSYLCRILIGSRMPLTRQDFDRKHRITVGCFDRLPGLDFRRRLREYGISETTSWYSMSWGRKDWDRRFMPAAQRERGRTDANASETND